VLLDGLSLGGGSELALSAQAIVATPAGSMGFPETGIGIYPGLGGMIRFARHVGPELTKYYVFTGKSIKADEAYDLGIITRLVSPESVDSAIKEVVAAGKPDKYRKRTIPSKYDPFIKMCSGENIDKMLARLKPEGLDNELAEKTQKMMSVKAPLALKYVNDLIDKQIKMSIPDAIELELSHLYEMFSAEDVLAGLTTLGKTEYKGK
jgi:enoyl-CoA hydratase / 3-hydroxyacyl-CoA dehydrogenase